LQLLCSTLQARLLNWRLKGWRMAEEGWKVREHRHVYLKGLNPAHDITRPHSSSHQVQGLISVVRCPSSLHSLFVPFKNIFQPLTCRQLGPSSTGHECFSSMKWIASLRTRRKIDHSWKPLRQQQQCISVISYAFFCHAQSSSRSLALSLRMLLYTRSISQESRVSHCTA
jgi:hypothetical protein